MAHHPLSTPASPGVASASCGRHLPLQCVLNSSDGSPSDSSAPLSSSVASAPPAKRKRLTPTPLVTADSPVTVEPLGRRDFASWDEAEAFISAYAARTFQVLTVKSATPVSTRINLTRERLNAMTPAQQEGFLAQDKLIPEHFGAYSKALICTHGAKARHRGKGERVNQQHRALGCPAKLSLCVSRGVGGWRVRVTDQNCEHNHALSAELFATYPVNRRVTDERVLEIVREMRRYGTPRRGIFEFIKKRTGKPMGMKDVHNLLAKMKKEDKDAEAAEGRGAEGGGEGGDAGDEEEEEEE